MFGSCSCWFGRMPDAPDGINCDYSGQTNNLIPEYSGVLGLSYDNDFGSGWRLTGAAELLFSDDYLLAPNLDPRLAQDAYTMLNAHVAIAIPDGSWEFALVGKNLSDEEILSFGNDVPLAGGSFGAPGFFAFVGQPRTVALQISWIY